MNPHTCADSIRAEREQHPPETFTRNTCDITIWNTHGDTTRHHATIDADSTDYSDILDALILGAYQTEDAALAQALTAHDSIDITITDTETHHA